MVGRARRIQVELDALVADVAAVRDEVTGTRARRLHRHRRRAGSSRSCSSAVTRDHPKVHVVVVDATTTSLVPQLARRPARPRRRQPAGHRPRRRRPSRCSTRTASSSRPTATRSPAAAASRSPSSPSTSCCSSRRAPRSATSSTREAAAAGVDAARQGRGRRPAPHRLARVRGLRRRHRAGHRRAAPGSRASWRAGRRRRARPGARSAWPGAGAACCRPRPGRCATPSCGVVADRGAGIDGRPPESRRNRLRPAAGRSADACRVRPRRVRPPGLARPPRSRRSAGREVVLVEIDRRAPARRALRGRRAHVRRPPPSTPCGAGLPLARPASRRAAPTCTTAWPRSTAGAPRPARWPAARASCRSCSPPPARSVSARRCCSAWPTTW